MWQQHMQLRFVVQFVFVDCEINTGNIDTDKIEKYINKKQFVYV